MTHLIYIYFIITSLMVGYNFRDSYRFDKVYFTVFSSVILFFLGGILIPFYYLILFSAEPLGWMYREISFNYRFYFTKYWDNIFLDDSYSEEFKTREEKLKQANKLAEYHGTEQFKRHNRKIQKRYGR